MIALRMANITSTSISFLFVESSFAAFESFGWIFECGTSRGEEGGKVEYV